MAQRQAELVHFAVRLAECPSAPTAEFAFSGRSNVGKSSLINALLRRKRLAYVSGQPGKTQTLVYYLIDGGFHLVDMPGYGFAKISPARRREWAKASAEYLRGRQQLAGVLQLLDLGVGPTEDDRKRCALVSETGRPICAVFTKSDKVPRQKREGRVHEALARLRLAPETGVVLSSTREGSGLREIWAWIDDQLATADAGRGRN